MRVLLYFSVCHPFKLFGDFMKRLCLLAAVCMALLPIQAAWGEGFAVYEWSARSVGLGGATMSRAPDPSIIASNPAAMTRLGGTQLQGGLSLVMPVGKIKFNDAAYGMDKRYKVADEYWPMPSFYLTHQATDRLSIGIAEYTRFGLGLDYPKHWDGRYNIHNIQVKSMSLTPAAAVKVTDSLSLGAALEFMYLDVIIKKAVPTGTPVDGQIDVQGDNVSVGANLSMHYQLNDQWAFGAIYRSPVQHQVEGESWLDLPGGRHVSRSANANLTLPESVSASVAYSPIPELSFELIGTWTRWSRFRYLNLHFEDGSRANSTKHWKDAWRLGLGVEYSPVEWLDLRAGYVWDQCPVSKANEDYLIPTDNRQIFSLGSGIHLDNWTIDLAYAFLYAHKRNYASRPADGVFASETYDTRTHIASFSVTYRF